jgi:hypothetical protein
MDGWIFYAGAALSASLLAVGLEFWGREHWEPDGTIGLVYVGVTLTGAWVALYIALGALPALAGQDMAVWTWWMTFWMFWATGIPITVWQFWQARRRLADVIAYLTRSRRVNERDDGDALAAPCGRDAQADD